MDEVPLYVPMQGSAQHGAHFLLFLSAVLSACSLRASFQMSLHDEEKNPS